MLMNKPHEADLE